MRRDLREGMNAPRERGASWWSTFNDIVIGASVALSLTVVFLSSVMWLKILLTVFVAIGIVAAWPRASRLVRACSAGSLAFGIVGVAMTQATVFDVAAGVTQMAAIFAFLVVVRLLELPIRTGRFNDAIAHWLTVSARLKNRAVAGGLLTYGLTSGLSIGAVPIAYRSVESLWADAAHENVKDMGQLVTRSFTAGNAWTPVSPIVAVALDTTLAPLPPVFAWIVPLSLVAIALSLFAHRRRGRGVQEPVTDPNQGIGEFLLACGTMMALIVALGHVWAIGPIGATMSSIIMVAVVWQMSLSGAVEGPRLVWRSLKAQSASWPEQFILFCSGGLLVGAALALSRDWHGQAPSALADNAFLVVLLVPVLIAVLAALGLYPFVSLAAFGTMLGPQVSSDVLTPLALSLIVGASVGFLISPFSGLTLLIGSMANRSSFDVGVRWNVAYGSAFLVAGTASALLAYWVR